jgi:predicted chitinase
MHFHFVTRAWNVRMEDGPGPRRGSRQRHNVFIAQFAHERTPLFRLAQNLQRPSNGKSG